MDARNALALGVAALRKERGWTQLLLAEKANVSLQFIAAIEQAAKSPSLDTIDKLCAVFRAQPSELFAAGEASTGSRSGPSRELMRAAAALPAEREDEIVELLHVVSRMLASPARAKRIQRRARVAR